MISAVAEKYGVHPQTLRMYEREGLLKPSRSDGNTRLYTEEDLERLEVILELTRELGVNLAGVEIILNMREKMSAMQLQIEQFVASLNVEFTRNLRPVESESKNMLIFFPEQMKHGTIKLWSGIGSLQCFSQHAISNRVFHPQVYKHFIVHRKVIYFTGNREVSRYL